MQFPTTEKTTCICTFKDWNYVHMHFQRLEHIELKNIFKSLFKSSKKKEKRTQLLINVYFWIKKQFHLLKIIQNVYLNSYLSPRLTYLQLLFQSDKESSCPSFDSTYLTK